MSKAFMSEKEKYKEMINTPIFKLIPKLAFFTVSGMLLTSVYSLIDMLFVSRLGRDQAGAVGVVFSIIAIIQAAGYTFGMGGGSSISRSLGKKKTEDAENIAMKSLVGGVIAGCIITVVCLIWLKPLLYLLGATKLVIKYAMIYGKIIGIGAPFMCGAFVLNNVLRAVGKPGLELIGIGVGGAVNVALDPLLIFVFDFKIAGAAMATVAGQIVCFILMLIFICRKKAVIGLKPAYIFKTFKDYWGIVKMGLPSMFRQGLVAVAAVYINRKAGNYGEDALAAVSMSGRVFMIVYSGMVGYGQGFAPVVGFSYGSHENKRIHEATVFTMWSLTLAALAAAVINYFGSDFIMGLFKADKNVREIGSLAIKYSSLSYIFIPVATVAGILFQSTGSYIKAALVYSARQGFFFIPSIYILNELMKLKGILLTQPIADILSGILATIFVFVALKKEYTNS